MRNPHDFYMIEDVMIIYRKDEKPVHPADMGSIVQLFQRRGIELADKPILFRDAEEKYQRLVVGPTDHHLVMYIHANTTREALPLAKQPCNRIPGPPPPFRLPVRALAAS
ncbi:MAG: hypothetical protein SFW62_03630 [Alphaproteobacteria bacterium]|nr:hypothetical protein [Alphaproteobacteria bacterium]